MIENQLILFETILKKIENKLIVNGIEKNVINDIINKIRKIYNSNDLGLFFIERGVTVENGVVMRKGLSCNIEVTSYGEISLEIKDGRDKINNSKITVGKDYINERIADNGLYVTEYDSRYGIYTKYFSEEQARLLEENPNFSSAIKPTIWDNMNYSIYSQHSDIVALNTKDFMQF